MARMARLVIDLGALSYASRARNRSIVSKNHLSHGSIGIDFSIAFGHPEKLTWISTQQHFVNSYRKAVIGKLKQIGFNQSSLFRLRMR